MLFPRQLIFIGDIWMNKLLKYVAQWLCHLRPLKYVAQLSCHLRSSLYNIGGILGISFAVNLMTANCTRSTCQAFSLCLFAIAPLFWFLFGIFCFIYAITFSDIERNYVTKDGIGMTQFIAKELLNENIYAPIYCIGMLISLFISIGSTIVGAI